MLFALFVTVVARPAHAGCKWEPIDELWLCLPPAVSITSPANNSGATAPAQVNVSVSASDYYAQSSIVRVDLYRNDVLIASQTSGFNFVVSGLAAGTHTFKAYAVDSWQYSD